MTTIPAINTTGEKVMVTPIDPTQGHHPTVVQALAAVMAEVQSVGKDGKNTQQGYNFRGIDGVVNAVGPALRKHGVVIIPTLLESSYRDIEVGKNRTLMREVTVTVRYTIHGPAGDTLEGTVVGESMDSGDKGTAKAFSVAYRTFLLQALTIPTHQPDPDEQSYERSEAVPQEDPAVPGLRSSIEAAIGRLDDEQKAALKEWFVEQQLPAVRRLNAVQAAAVIDHLMALEVEGAGDQSLSEAGSARVASTPAPPEHEGEATDAC
jgi:hypothetical protein